MNVVTRIDGAREKAEPRATLGLSPAYFLPCFLSRACVNADAAADFSAEVDLGSRRTFDAKLATRGVVRSFLAMIASIELAD